MMAMRYGCLPLARATGGLKDTIVDVSTSPDSGTGFLFEPAKPKAFAKALSDALKIFKDRSNWQEIQKRGMAQDFSWKNSALNYVDLYLGLL
jgi:starch synthase